MSNDPARAPLENASTYRAQKLASECRQNLIESSTSAWHKFTLPDLTFHAGTVSGAEAESIITGKEALRSFMQQRTAEQLLTWETVVGAVVKSERNERKKDDDQIDEFEFQQVRYVPAPTISENRSETVSAPSDPTSEKRYVFGGEIALAVLVGVMGATRIRALAHKGPLAELIPGDNIREEIRELAFEPEDDSKSTFTNFKQSESEEIDFQPSSGEDQKIPQPTRPKLLISATDTLTKIAEAFFLNRDIAWLIADINRDRITETQLREKRVVEIKSRQMIELPLQHEVNNFLLHKTDFMTAENIITVVEESALNLEFVNGSLETLLSED